MKKNEIIRVSPNPHSIVGLHQKIKVTFKQKLDENRLLDTISFGRNASASVELSEDKKSLLFGIETCQNGQFELTIGALRSANKKSETVPTTLMYHYNEALDCGENLPQGSILHYKTVKLPLSGQSFRLVKMETEKGRAKTVALDANNKIQAFDKALAAEGELYAKKYGKLHPNLYDYLENVSSNKSVKVALWMANERKVVDKSRYSTEELDKLAKKLEKADRNFAAKQTDLVRSISKQCKLEVLHVSTSTPIVEVSIKPKELKALLKNEAVQIAFLAEQDGVEDLDNAMDIANADFVVDNMGYTGRNVRVAVFERGPNDTSDLNIQGFYDPSQNAKSSHATTVIGIIKNTQANGRNGFAPNCRMYSANSTSLAALEWAVKDQRCTVVNQSFHRNSEPHSENLSYDDIVKDYLAIHYPYPTIVQAAGNFWSTDPDNVNPPESEYVNHKGYNTISIGNHNDSATGMSASSVFRNPKSAHGDRELPELAANGTGFTLFGSNRGSGTSYSSPAVAGSVALMQEASTTLKYWPEACRAILAASARRNISNNTWWSDVLSNVDAKDGAGALDAAEAIRISERRSSKNNAASNRGWDIGRLTDNSFNNGLSTFEYKVRVPWGFPFSRRKKVKVALCWNSEVSTWLNFYINSQLKLDFDLKIYNAAGQIVASSNSWDNSYEIAEFDGVPGQTYTIKIRKWSGTGNTYFGIAWSAGSSLFIGQTSINEQLLERVLHSGI